MQQFLAPAGKDPAGDCLAALIEESGLYADIVIHPSRPTTVKSRILARGQQMLRFDREQTGPYTTEEENDLLERTAALLPRCKAVVVSDYGKGLCKCFFYARPTGTA